jgi:NitT/TauT family transport system permease protein
MPDSNPRPSMPVVCVSVGALCVIWVLAAWATHDPAVLPGPAEVWRIVMIEAQSGELQRHIWATLLRVAAAFALAMAAGTVAGLLLGFYPALNRWFGPWLIVLLNIPALVVIVLCYLWIGLNELAAVTAVALNKMAMVAVTLREGVQALDPKVAEMARVFRMRPLQRLRHVTLPQLWPYFAASTRNGLAIIWKIVLVVEFLGRSDGIGFQIHLYFQLFETRYVLAYALSFVFLMLALEYGALQTLERRATSWRQVAPR